MAWITLALYEQTVEAQINNMETEDLSLSREKNYISRHLSLEKSMLQLDETNEIMEAKEAYDEVKDQRPSVSSDDYDEWYAEYSDAKEEYQEAKTDIEDYYDMLYEEIEEEATRKQTFIEEEQTVLETNLEDLRQELDSVKEQKSTDIQNSAIKFA